MKGIKPLLAIFSFLNPILIYWRVGVLAAVILGVGVLEWKVYNAGYDKAEGIYIAAAQAEKLREVEVNKKALAAAQADKDALNTQINNLNQELSDNDLKAFKAQHANDTCIGTDGVSRLNSYGHKTHTRSGSKPTKVPSASKTRWFFKPKSS